MKKIGLFVLSVFIIGFLMQRAIIVHSASFFAEQVAKKAEKEGQIVTGHLDKVTKDYIIVDGQRYRRGTVSEKRSDGDLGDLLGGGSLSPLVSGQFVQFILDNNVANEITVLRPE